MWEGADVQWWWRRPRATDELALPVWFDEVGPVAAAGLTGWGGTWLDGRAVSGPGPERGVVFQSFALFPWKTVLENVAFGPKMRGLAKLECEKIAREYLALAGLAHAADRYPNELSGGM